MGFSHLSRPFTGVTGGTTSRITSLNPGGGTLGIKNEVYLAGSFQVIAGFSRIFALPPSTRSIQVGADFLVSGEITAIALHLSYARANFFVNIQAMGLGLFGAPNGDNHVVQRPIAEQVSAVYSQSPPIERFFSWYWLNDMDSFTPRSDTRSYLLSATIESWAGAGGLAGAAIANIFDQTTFQGFFVTTIP